MNRLKKLFSDYVRGKTTTTEKRIVELWYDKKASAHTDIISDEEAEVFSKQAWSEFVLLRNKQSSATTRNALLAFGGLVAAAMVLFVVVLNFSFSKKNNRDEGMLTTEMRISRQFTTQDRMKKITLPDGSKIFMNLGTSISMYEGKFNAHQREIWLDEGEAFFEVIKNVNRPFIIHTPNGLTTRVVGTSFNIRAYKDLEEQIISVNTGRVQVTDNKQNTIVIDPDNKVTYSYKDGQIFSDRTDAKKNSAWQTGLIILENAGIKEVAFRLKQVFDINVDFEGITNRQDRIHASFSRDIPLQEVLEDICKLYDIQYTITNNSVKLFN
ncbi:FecR family protein [Proteiniphilum sp. UBA1028]|jgi:ferric-dicitrate binding protein FerR (iron transport regulator)|uniref:FecR family protein n=1 Tax=Proteiniphilum sp. UBA1028 TaxID=1947251 RepID=UPI0025CED663|nr:FecR family protein [Proteiniphilum sp. UBA1028]